MKMITNDDYKAMQRDSERVEALAAKVALLAASLRQADARNDALVEAMKIAARKLEGWPKDPWQHMRDVAAELRQAARAT